MSTATTLGLQHTDPISSSRAKAWASELLSLADVKINGSRPWDMEVHDERFYDRVLREGTLGLGEAYMDGWWESESLDEFFARVLSAHLQEHLRLTPSFLWGFLRMRLLNAQSRSRAYEVGERHYDIGNDLFKAMLDPTMTYSCGYWKEATSLEEAQRQKLDLVCRKLDLKPGHRVLDIGCGWGSFAEYAAEQYGVKVVGVTISKEQAAYAEVRCDDLPVEIRLQDYREIQGTFDRIVSIGMFEHVGRKNDRTYMEVVARSLKEDGLFLLHTIGSNAAYPSPDPWIERYIFPNGILPAASQVTAAYEKHFLMEDWHNFGVDYDPTLKAWFANFERHWPSLAPAYGERFYRMWKYYLLSCAGLFRAREAQVWQIVLAKNGVPGGYGAVR